MIKNEVGLMMLCKENEGILKCLEAFDYKNKLWLFLEIMDEPLTPIVESYQSKYSENCCKYVLLKTLQGLNYLH